jgi:hypothetical protein
MLAGMEKRPGKGIYIAYIVVAVLLALTAFFSAVGKFTLNPGAVHVINEVVGVPMGFFPVLALCEIAGGIGLLVGIIRPKLGVAAAAGLVLYFFGAIVAHILVGDWAGITAPITPLAFSVAALALGVVRMRRA